LIDRAASARRIARRGMRKQAAASASRMMIISMALSVAQWANGNRQNGGRMGGQASGGVGGRAGGKSGDGVIWKNRRGINKAPRKHDGSCAAA